MPAEMMTPWTWSWGPHGGLASQARFGDNMPFDIIRVLLVVAGALLVSIIARVLAEQARRRDLMSRSQTARFVALGLAAISISVTEAWIVGTTATPRLFVNFAVIVFGIWGVVGKRSRQKREPLADGFSTTQGDNE